MFILRSVLFLMPIKDWTDVKSKISKFPDDIKLQTVITNEENSRRSQYNCRYGPACDMKSNQSSVKRFALSRNVTSTLN